MPDAVSPAALAKFETFGRQALLDAGEQTLRYFRQAPAVSNKAAAGTEMDPVTVADEAAEALLRDRILATWPGHDIVGEEGSDELSGADWTWTIDPIDGTRGFVAGFVHWGMLLALSFRGVPVLGLVHQPYTGELWSGSSLGAYFEHRGERQQISVRAGSELDGAIMATTDPYLFQGAERAAFEGLRAACALTRYGADCYAYCMLAHGQLDLVLESGLQPWDVRALVPLVEAAGGVISDWRGGPCHDGGQVLAAATPALQARAIDLLEQHLRP